MHLRQPGFRRRVMRSLWIVIAPFIAAAAPLAHAQPAWKPERNVEIISGTAAGGAVDKANRTVQKIWQDRKIVEATTAVVNKPGGGNTIAWNYINSHAGDGHYVSIAPYTLLTNKIVGASTLTWSDFTLIALLFNEYMTVSVRTDSPIRTARDLVERLRKDPGSLSIAVASTLGNHIHIGIAKALKSAGVDIKKLKVVAFKSSGESVTNLLGGHIDVVSSTTPNVLAQHQAGRIRLIAITSLKRMPGALAEVPTWKEQGVEGTFSASQGAIGPRGITPAMVSFWENAFLRLSQSEEWRKELAGNFWEGNFLGTREVARYYEAQAAELREILTDLGLAKQ
ncbi:MAG: tripartite tricarboxylate transporter substrate binding protein [Betaproteobacteria bacterium]|nr:tripartite tricarboxylate transporter substrate binding protein [Betaproteobacteria bacterium]